MHQIINSIFHSITYILPTGKHKECFLVDCGDVEKVVEMGWCVRGVLLTHTHFDHIYGLNKLVTLFPSALVYTNEAGKAGLQNPKWNFSRYHEGIENFIFSKPGNIKVLYNETTIELSEETNIQAIFTPGHEPSCISYLCNDRVFTGDAYIPGIKTVVTFPRSNRGKAAESLARLRALENDGLSVYPGHDISSIKISQAITLD